MAQELLAFLYRTMVKIRKFEEKAEELFLGGQLPGFIHLYIGEEAIATGICSALTREDLVTSTHRGHGHCIAKGADVKKMMAELFGKKTGYCKGKGGSMHIADFSLCMLGANGVVGGGFNLATGAALAAKLRKSGQVAVCFFGDGASNRGTFHEAVNMASAWKLPAIFVLEMNCYASTTPYRTTCGVENLAVRAQGYGIPGVTVDGNDVFAVRQAALEAVARARAGEGPTMIEARTYRVKGHFVGDPELYREKSEVNAKKELCPIRFFRDKVKQEGWLTQAEMDLMETAAAEELAAALKFAEESPYPQPEEALKDLFAEEVDDYA